MRMVEANFEGNFIYLFNSFNRKEEYPLLKSSFGLAYQLC